VRGIGVAGDVDRHAGVGLYAGEQRLAEVGQGGRLTVDEHLTGAVDGNRDGIRLELRLAGGGAFEVHRHAVVLVQRHADEHERRQQEEHDVDQRDDLQPGPPVREGRGDLHGARPF